MQDLESPENYWQWHKDNAYTPIINVSGTMTGLGASSCRKPVQTAVVDALSRFVKIHEMQTRASSVIASLTGSEAGCLTASASAGITLSIAGCMTGLDPARAVVLPDNPGDRAGVAVQLGHLCNYGAPITSAVMLAGAKVYPVGQATHVMDYQLEAALSAQCAAALYVVSHHVVNYGQIPFARFVSICHEHTVPVVVDAASEYDLTGFIDAGADLVVYSAHKCMGGPTAGIIAGRRDLVRAAYLQNIGIGRGFKIGKESIAGAIAAMEEWMIRDHAAVRAEESQTLELWLTAVDKLPGITAERIPDPTGNPLERLQVNVDAAIAGASAAVFAQILAQQKPALIVRGHEVELGYFQLDPCNLAPGQAEIVADILSRILSAAPVNLSEEVALHAVRNGDIDAYLKWLSWESDQ